MFRSHNQLFSLLTDPLRLKSVSLLMIKFSKKLEFSMFNCNTCYNELPAFKLDSNKITNATLAMKITNATLAK